MSPRRIRILHVITSLAGGAGLHVLQLARHLDRARFDVRVAFGPGYPLDAEVEALGLPTRTLAWTRAGDPFAALRGASQLSRWLREDPVDVLHAHCSLAGAAGRVVGSLRGVPHVLFTFHALASRDWQPAWRQRVLLAAERSLDRFTQHYCVTTESLREQVLARGITAGERVSRVPLGIEIPDRPTPDARRAARARLGLREGELAVFTAGRLEEQKGVAHLIEAFAGVRHTLPEARLLIAGDGPLRAQLESRARSLGVASAVRFLGWRDDVRELLPGADLFCLASLWESFGYVLLEAMAAELPVVATHVDGVPEVVEADSTALLVPPARPDALLHALVALLRDPGQRAKLGQAGRRRLEDRFSVSHMIAGHERVYADVCQRRPPPLEP